MNNFFYCVRVEYGDGGHWTDYGFNSPSASEARTTAVEKARASGHPLPFTVRVVTDRFCRSVKNGKSITVTK